MNEATLLFSGPDHQAWILLVVGCFLLFSWHMLGPLRHSISRCVVDPWARRSAPYFVEYTAKANFNIAIWFLVAWGGWLIFYTLRALLPPEEFAHSVFVQNLFSNVTTFAFIACYFRLSAPRPKGLANWEFQQLLMVAWLFILLSVTTYEVLLEFRDHEPSAGRAIHQKTVMTIYGLGQGLALFLIIGRLETGFITAHLRANGGARSGTLITVYKACIFIGYLYAAVQPLYPVLASPNEPLGEALLAFALVGKLFLALLFSLLFVPIPFRQGISPFQHYLYEIERFTLEELADFERDFLRRHFGHSERQNRSEHGHGAAHHHLPDAHGPHGKPNLGIVRSYLNQFKCERLGLLPLHAVEDMVHGGMWIQFHHIPKEEPDGTHRATPRTVHEKTISDSTEPLEVLRFGDYITHINQVPIGKNNRLSSLIKGSSVGEHVNVTVMRHEEDAASVISVAPFRWDAYQKKMFHWSKYNKVPIRLKLYSADAVAAVHKEHLPMKIPFEYLYNSPFEGVVCKYMKEDGQRDPGGSPVLITGISLRLHDQHRIFKIPDIHMLAMVLKQCTPPEQIVTVYGAGFSNGTDRMEVTCVPVEPWLWS